MKLFHPISRLFQSPHPRRVRQSRVLKTRLLISISIPAPTKGATVQAQLPSEIQRISIPAPTKGATLPVGMGSSKFMISIPAPTKGATGERLVKLYKEYISIPAPTKGATYTIYVTHGAGGDFNPRTHEGCDDWTEVCRNCWNQFQSPHPRRVRLSGNTEPI